MATNPITPKLAQVDPPQPFLAILRPVGIALVIAAIAAGLLFHFSHERPVADGAILQTAVYSVHSVAKANLGVPGTIAQGEVSDQTYVSCVIKLNNRLQKLPLFIEQEAGTVVTSDGQEVQNTAARAVDIPRFFQAYPAAATVHGTPLARETKLEAGQAAQGLVLVNFPISQDAWNNRKSASITITFYHQKPLTLPIPAGN